ncbi:ABC transporter permease [Phenylobacterium sp.]|jgi:sulfonate transport system permease protein|uniref:ABC transporter permease n=1 Tax=Phenylobacterium sp. TaxID=1871053 RepID=UPI002E367D9F|nr:ABC transporter permease [Phenylobacterium sp.]HEX2560139.1 ABC transporter permease [Phenylobacterium sp.]
MSAQAVAAVPPLFEEVRPANDVAPTPVRPPRKRRLGLDAPDPLGWLLGPALLLFAWTLGAWLGLIDPRVLPAPWTAVATAVDLIREGRLQANLAVSAWRAAQGLGWGVAAGLVVALVSGLSLLGGYLFDGLVQVKRAIPTLALIPLAVIWFGIGETMKVTVIALSVFVPIYLNTHNALRGIDARYVELAETLGLSRLGFIRQVVLPGALPGFILGLRYAVMSAWLALVVVEQLNATSGVGYMINLARTYAQTDVIVVGLVVYALLGLASDLSVRALEARLLAWRRTLGQ